MQHHKQNSNKHKTISKTKLELSKLPLYKKITAIFLENVQNLSTIRRFKKHHSGDS